MKRLMIGLLLCLLVGTVLAETMDSYTLSPAQIDIEALKALTFQEDAGKAARDVSRNYEFYDMDNDGPPFCGANDQDFGSQNWFSAYRTCALGEHHEEGLWENVEPTGTARTALTRDEALHQAEDIAQRLKLGDCLLQSVIAYGKIEVLAPSYKVAFGQALHGLPVYRAALHDADAFGPDSNRVTIVLGDCGLYSIQGSWSAFAPAGKPGEILDEGQAIALFAFQGISADEAEKCYLIQPDASGDVAVPAYRYRNSFIHAVTGEALQ